MGEELLTKYDMNVDSIVNGVKEIIKRKNKYGIF